MRSKDSPSSLTCSFIEMLRCLNPEELGIEYNTYVNGLAECIGELRRRCWILRRIFRRCERLLATMDVIYNFLVTGLSR